MTTETNEERLGRLIKISNNVLVNGANTTSLSLKDINWLIARAEVARELENYCLKSANFINQVDLEKENASLQELVKILKVHAVHCDADERAIQPYEIIDVINEFTTGEVNGQR